jgi:hypothetical protein
LLVKYATNDFAEFEIVKLVGRKEPDVLEVGRRMDAATNWPALAKDDEAVLIWGVDDLSNGNDPIDLDFKTRLLQDLTSPGLCN